LKLARRPTRSALRIAPLPSISEIPFPRFSNLEFSDCDGYIISSAALARSDEGLKRLKRGKLNRQKTTDDTMFGMTKHE
jgi:hypothetical protein